MRLRGPVGRATLAESGVCVVAGLVLSLFRLLAPPTLRLLTPSEREQESPYPSSCLPSLQARSLRSERRLPCQQPHSVTFWGYWFSQFVRSYDSDFVKSRCHHLGRRRGCAGALHQLAGDGWGMARGRWSWKKIQRDEKHASTFAPVTRPYKN